MFLSISVLGEYLKNFVYVVQPLVHVSNLEEQFGHVKFARTGLHYIYIYIYIQLLSNKLIFFRLFFVLSLESSFLYFIFDFSLSSSRFPYNVLSSYYYPLISSLIRLINSLFPIDSFLNFVLKS